MDCVPVYKNGKSLCDRTSSFEKGDLVVVGRTEDCQDGIYVHANGFGSIDKKQEVFAFRQNRSEKQPFQETMMNFMNFYIMKKEHGYVVWVMGPAFSFDSDARNAFSSWWQTAT